MSLWHSKQRFDSKGRTSVSKNLFASRWDTFDGNARVSGRKMEQLQTQIIALQSQIVALNKRLMLTQQEADTVELLRREFGSDLLAGISIVTSALNVATHSLTVIYAGNVNYSGNAIDHAIAAAD